MGLLRPGPGTWGTVAGTLVYALYAPWLSFAGQTAVAIAALVLALWACGRTVRDAGVDDHGSIVIDEVVAMWLALPFVTPEPLWWAAAIVVFRIFDVFKFWPICWLDRNLKGGLGVMMDDVAAAFFTALVLVLGGALLF